MGLFGQKKSDEVSTRSDPVADAANRIDAAMARITDELKKKKFDNPEQMAKLLRAVYEKTSGGEAVGHLGIGMEGARDMLSALQNEGYLKGAGKAEHKIEGQGTSIEYLYELSSKGEAILKPLADAIEAEKKNEKGNVSQALPALRG